MATTADFPLVTLNGEAVRTLATSEPVWVEIDGCWYDAADAASPDYLCRRCLFHEDFGGCIVDEVLYSFLEAWAA